jgi:hypothetical protein
MKNEVPVQAALTTVPFSRTARTVGVVWLLMIGMDFFLHGGLLAGLYLGEQSFLLPPKDSFARIPLGYLALLLAAILLVWLMGRLNISGARDGFLFGLQLGVLVWGAQVLGLASVTTADPLLLAGWFAGQSIELGIAGAIAGMALAGARLSRLFVLALLAALGLAVITVVMQSLGFAPAVRIQG